MSILKTPTPLQRVEKQSADALGIFRATVERLADTNKTIEIEKNRNVKNTEAEKRRHQVEMQRLSDEKTQFEQIENRNSRVMSKINEFFETLST